jgi:hypothetical protein
VDFRLTFLPKNQLSSTSMIYLAIPISMQFSSYKQQLFYIEYGLDDLSDTQPVKFLALSNVIKIWNYKPMAVPGLISLIFRLQMPQVNKGITSAI